MASDRGVKRSDKFIIGGAYEVVTPIGRGRNSVVYKARCLPAAPVANFIQTYVALKILVGGDRELLIRRTKREANALLASRDENVVKLIDYVARRESCYIAMEFVDRSDLRTILDKQPVPLSAELALDFTAQLLAGLERIHSAGIIHRDIKPENLLVTNDYVLKITDFGIAFLPSEEVGIEEANRGIGTFDYLAPESLEDGLSNVRTDLYAAAVSCYQLLTHHLPFGGMTFTEQITNKLEGHSIPLSHYLSEAPLMLEALLRKGFAADPEKRFQTAAEFREAIEAYKKGRWNSDPQPLPPLPGGGRQIVLPPNRPPEDEEDEYDLSFAEEEGEAEEELEQKDFQHGQAAPETTTDDQAAAALDFDTKTGVDGGGPLLEGRSRRAQLRTAAAALVACTLLFAAIWTLAGMYGAEKHPEEAARAALRQPSAPAPPVPIGAQPVESLQPEQPQEPLPAGPDFSVLLEKAHRGVLYGLLGEVQDTAFASAPTPNGERVFFALGLDGAPVVPIERAELEGSRSIELRTGGMHITLTLFPDQEGRGMQGVYKDHGTGAKGSWRIW